MGKKGYKYSMKYTAELGEHGLSRSSGNKNPQSENRAGAILSASEEQILAVLVALKNAGFSGAVKWVGSSGSHP